MVICKKCGGDLIPFVKNMEKETMDRALRDHECKENKDNGKQ